MDDINSEGQILQSDRLESWRRCGFLLLSEEQLFKIQRMFCSLRPKAISFENIEDQKHGKELLDQSFAEIYRITPLFCWSTSTKELITSSFSSTTKRERDRMTHMCNVLSQTNPHWNAHWETLLSYLTDRKATETWKELFDRWEEYVKKKKEQEQATGQETTTREVAPKLLPFPYESDDYNTDDDKDD